MANTTTRIAMIRPTFCSPPVVAEAPTPDELGAGPAVVPISIGSSISLASSECPTSCSFAVSTRRDLADLPNKFPRGEHQSGTSKHSRQRDRWHPFHRNQPSPPHHLCVGLLVGRNIRAYFRRRTGARPRTRCSRTLCHQWPSTGPLWCCVSRSRRIRRLWTFLKCVGDSLQFGLKEESEVKGVLNQFTTPTGYRLFRFFCRCDVRLGLKNTSILCGGHRFVA